MDMNKQHLYYDKKTTMVLRANPLLRKYWMINLKKEYSLTPQIAYALINHFIDPYKMNCSQTKYIALEEDIDDFAVNYPTFFSARLDVITDSLTKLECEVNRFKLINTLNSAIGRYNAVLGKPLGESKLTSWYTMDGLKLKLISSCDLELAAKITGVKQHMFRDVYSPVPRKLTKALGKHLLKSRSLPNVLFEVHPEKGAVARQLTRRYQKIA